MNESYFGKSYSHTGDINSDFLIKTRGDVVVQCNRQFVKLISGGRINVDFEFIFEVNNVDDIENGQDGIYYIEDGKIYIKIGDNIIALTEEEKDGDFVSYIDLQGVDDFKIAQQNIGLLQEDVTTIEHDKIPESGIMFDNATRKFYYINENQELVSLGFEIPELIKHNIKIDGENALGSLALLGLGKEKGLSIGNTIFIYATDNSSNFESNEDLNFIVNGNTVFKITEGGIFFTDNTKIVTNIIESLDGNFKLIDKNGESTLYVDNIVTKQNEVTYEEAIKLILEEKLIPKKEYTITDFQNEWEILKDDIRITEDIFNTNDDGEIIFLDEDQKIPSIKLYKNIHKLVLIANSNNSFLSEGYYQDNNYKVHYDITPRFLEDPVFPEDLEDEGSNKDIEFTLDPMYKGRIIKLTDVYNNTANYDFKNLRFYNSEKKQWYYTFNNLTYNIDNSENGLLHNNNIHLNNPVYYKQPVSYKEDVETLSDITNDTEIENIIIGDIKKIKEGNYISFNNLINNTTINDIIGDNIFSNKLEFVTFDNLEKASFEKDLKYVSFHGNINKDIFKESEYPLLYDNTKQKEVYRNGDRYDVIFIPDLIIPSGLIAMWFKDEIPSGWVICDGTNNTPNLIDKFVKGSNKAGEEGGSNEVIITEDNLPNHKHGIKFDISSNPSEEQDTNFKHTHDISTSLSSMTPSSTDLKPLMFPATTSKNIETSSVDISGSISGGINDIEILPTGKGVPIKIEPKYYSMVYIMKL